MTTNRSDLPAADNLVAPKPLAAWQRSLFAATDDPNRSYNALIRATDERTMPIQMRAAVQLFARDLLGCLRNRAQVLTLSADIAHDHGDGDDVIRMAARAEALEWAAQQIGVIAGLCNQTVPGAYPFDPPQGWDLHELEVAAQGAEQREEA